MTEMARAMDDLRAAEAGVSEVMTQSVRALYEGGFHMGSSTNPERVRIWNEIEEDKDRKAHDDPGPID